MYGLPQVGWITHANLKNHLAKTNYTPCPHTLGLWQHATTNICFTLWVDNFLVKFNKKRDVDEFFNACKQIYKLTTYWSATKYVGLTIQWNYTTKRHATISMQNYVEHTLLIYQHQEPTRPKDSPHPLDVLSYGCNSDLNIQQVSEQEITDIEDKLIQCVTG